MPCALGFRREWRGCFTLEKSVRKRARSSFCTAFYDFRASYTPPLLESSTFCTASSRREVGVKFFYRCKKVHQPRWVAKNLSQLRFFKPIFAYSAILAAWQKGCDDDGQRRHAITVITGVPRATFPPAPCRRCHRHHKVEEGREALPASGSTRNQRGGGNASRPGPAMHMSIGAF